MGRRSSFPRIEKDRYPTPPEAVEPLLPHLRPKTRFIEPCAGDGRLVRALEAQGHRCVDAFDIEPLHPSVRRADALTEPFVSADTVITNPPWSRPVLHQLIERAGELPMWLLFDAEWAHTKQAAPYMNICARIVSVGRVRWIEGSKFVGKDSCAWYLFMRPAGATVFHGRANSIRRPGGRPNGTRSSLRSRSS